MLSFFFVTSLRALLLHKFDQWERQLALCSIPIGSLALCDAAMYGVLPQYIRRSQYLASIFHTFSFAHELICVAAAREARTLKRVVPSVIAKFSERTSRKSSSVLSVVWRVVVVSTVSNPIHEKRRDVRKVFLEDSIWDAITYKEHAKKRPWRPLTWFVSWKGEDVHSTVFVLKQNEFTNEQTTLFKATSKHTLCYFIKLSRFCA